MVKRRPAAPLVKTCVRCGGRFEVAPWRRQAAMCPACSCASYLESQKACHERRKARLKGARAW